MGFMEHKVRVGRRAYFSCGHSYKRDDLDVRKAQAIWGDLFAPEGWGHNFVLEVRCLVEPPGESGLSFSLSWMDEVLLKLTQSLDHTYLNQDVPWFQKTVPSVENIARYCFENLEQAFERSMERTGYGVSLESIRLFEDEGVWVDYFGLRAPVRLTKVYKVSALHRHHNPSLSMEDNRRLYHKCSTLHGHQYSLEVSAQSPLDPVSGIVVRREQLDSWVEEAVIRPSKGRILNDEMGNTSGELIFKNWEKRLKSAMGNHFGGLLLRETRKNYFQAAAGA